MPKQENKYYYLRSNILHCVERVTVDKAVRLSDSEAERLKAEITESPSCKYERLRDFWAFLTKTKGEKPFDFTEWFDRHCREKRRQAREREGV